MTENIHFYYYSAKQISQPVITSNRVESARWIQLKPLMSHDQFFRHTSGLEAKPVNMNEILNSNLLHFDIARSPYIPSRLRTLHIVLDLFRSKKLQISKKV